MTGADHYQKAENLIEGAMRHRFDRDGDWHKDPERHHIAEALIAEAQVHATLALAAATAINASDTSVPIPDWEAWKAVAGEQGERS